MTAADRRGSTASNTSGIHPAPPAAAAGGSGGRRSSTGGPGGPGAARGPNGSVLADLAARGELKAADGSTAAANAGPFAPRRFPTNADVVRAVHARAEQAAELCRAYRAAAAYVLFVALYMAALYAQAAAFGAAPAVGALRRALLDDPSRPALAFASGAQVLAYLGNRVVRPAWTDPVCGDGRCERPWEFPAWGPFGCRADCGAEPRTARVVVAATADFTGHALLGARALMAAARWNLCLDDGARRARGDADLCWFAEDQAFTQAQETQIRTMDLVEGGWYVKVTGDPAGRVSGAVYPAAADGAGGGGNGGADDAAAQPEAIPVEPAWDSCKTRRATGGSLSTATSPAAAAARRLQEALGGLKAAVGEAGARELLTRALVEAADVKGKARVAA